MAAAGVRVAIPDGYADELSDIYWRVDNLWKRIGNPQAYSEEVSEMKEKLLTLGAKRYPRR
jgi:hypothetical protein